MANPVSQGEIRGSLRCPDTAGGRVPVEGDNEEVPLAYPPCLAETFQGKDPSSVREPLFTAGRIARLTQSCISHHHRRCNAVTPSRLMIHRGEKRLWLQVFHGLRCETFYIGPPTWVEKQRVVAAFWPLQLFLEANPDDQMRGLGSDREVNDAWRLTPTGCSYWRRIMGPEVLTVLNYVDHIWKKPSHRTSMAMPNTTIIRTLETNLPEPLTRNDAMMPWYDLHQPPIDRAVRERQKELLQYLAAGMQFFQRMIKNPDCPLWQAPEDSLGLEDALEEGDKCALPLGPTIADKYFRWRSILCESDLWRAERRAESVWNFQWRWPTVTRRVLMSDEAYPSS
ncbi:hypothetical protein CI238_08168 [Colletotrichum incanum]|uniref:Uncharacterized protein n=1 Tax=Colletotrichum incanum TaxID=1573173 RepID=A0A161WGY7_COLIC|nr:hypothetical protein CI238_08168 [Colletotrichum incanum]